MRQRASGYNRTTPSSRLLAWLRPLLLLLLHLQSNIFSPLMTNDKVYFCAISETSFSPLCSRSLTLLIEGGQRKGGGGFLDDYLQIQMRITLCTPYSNLLFVSSLPHSVPSFCPPPPLWPYFPRLCLPPTGLFVYLYSVSTTTTATNSSSCGPILCLSHFF